MIRKRFEWKIRDRVLEVGERTLILGILNVTPDSFSDGGRFLDPEAALQRALDLEAAGADIIDVGAESTRPGSDRISEHEEIERLIPVLKKLKGRIEVPVSVDTYKPAVAELATQHGAAIINDVSGLTWHPELAKVARDTGAGLILNHMRGTPETWAKLAPMRDVLGEIASELEAAVHRARRHGVELDHIVIDPGIGFGKRKEQNSEILARLVELRRLGLPILVGPSRKLFLGQKDATASEFATAAAVTAAILNGADLVRVHDPAAIRAAVEVADAVVAAIPEAEEDERRPKGGRRVDFDLRPERQIAGPPRPIMKLADPAQSKRAPAESKPPQQETRPLRDRPLRESRPPQPGSRPPADRPIRDSRDSRQGPRPSSDRPMREGRDARQGPRPSSDRPMREGRDSRQGPRPSSDRPMRESRDSRPGPRPSSDRPMREGRDSRQGMRPSKDRPMREGRPQREDRPQRSYGGPPRKSEGDRRPPRYGAGKKADDRSPRYGTGKSDSRPPRDAKRPGRDSGRDNRGGKPGNRGPNTPRRRG